MVPNKCVFLFLNVATFRGISGQTHGINIKKIIDTLHCLKGTIEYQYFLAKMYILDQS